MANGIWHVANATRNETECACVCVCMCGWARSNGLCELFKTGMA